MPYVAPWMRQKFKDYILPLPFLKRLSDVFEDEVAHLAEELGGRANALRLVHEDHRLVPFYIPEIARWNTIRTNNTGLGPHLTEAVRAVARENPSLAGVIDLVDFNATAAGPRIVPYEYPERLVQVLSRHRLGLDDVEPDILGRAYEYLLPKFVEGQGQSAGEFYTPREVAILMTRILEPEPGMTVYDPCYGSGGLLIKCHLHLLQRYGVLENGRRKLPPQVAPLRRFGQEIDPATFAMAKMNAFIHDMEAEIALGETMRKPPSPRPMAAFVPLTSLWPIPCETKVSRKKCMSMIPMIAFPTAFPFLRAPTGVESSTCILPCTSEGAWPWSSTPAR